MLKFTHNVKASLGRVNQAFIFMKYYALNEGGITDGLEVKYADESEKTGHQQSYSGKLSRESKPSETTW